MSSPSLPRYVALQSSENNKYLNFVSQDVQIHGYLRFSGDDVLSPYAKFEVEPAKTGGGLVHIRSCYNNKYWVRVSQISNWLMAGADEPEEDQSKITCTLFEPVFVDGNPNVVRLRYMQNKYFAVLINMGNLEQFRNFCLCAADPQGIWDTLTVIDWESLLVLPKFVAFKGDNELYLSLQRIQNSPYLQFVATDKWNPDVATETFTTGDGSVRIQSYNDKRFWRRNSNWIWADSTDSTNSNRDTLFWPVKVDRNLIGLRNLGNNNFCRRFTNEVASCLNANIATITTEARLEVEELVISRTVYNVNFRLMDARIYGQTILTMATGDAVNRSPTESSTVELIFSFTETTTSSWNTSNSWMAGVTASVSFRIPFIGSAGIEVSGEYGGNYEWGEVHTSEKTVESRYTVVVPPMTALAVRMMASRASCDVPFAYTQRDVLLNGESVIYNKEDGLYTGANSYNFQYETEERQLLLSEMEETPLSETQDSKLAAAAVI